jgi:tetratricopeptide (TPR) repeat protein
VAVKVHENYESFFPTDVHYVADHAVRAMSSFPYAENDYYGISYHKRKGRNDLRRYNNIPVPTSYMVCETGYNFFGGYDHYANGGFIHVANRHIAPGKKQWTWGSAEFGQAWDRELTDHGGPYFELMAGVYTGNQPDFTYLVPFETKTFSQYWWGYQKLGPVQNANRDLAIRCEVLDENKLDLGVASSKKMEGLQFILKTGSETKVIENVTVSPESPWQNKDFSILPEQENSLSFIITDQSGKELLAYHNKEVSKIRNRPLAKEPPEAAEIENLDELNLVGEHLEQYRHPTRYPKPYWKEAIQKNPKDYRAFIALGKSLLKRGILQEAEEIFRKAIKILISYHPNPQTGEAHYFAGLSCLLQEKTDAAYALLYKATWNYACRSAGYYLLATIDCCKEDYETALEHLDASLDTNLQNNKAHILKAVLKRHQNKRDESRQILNDLLKVDPLDQWARFEKGMLTGNFDSFLKSSRNDAQTVIDIAFDYADAGFYEEAILLIELHHQSEIKECAVPNPMKKSAMTHFLQAWLYSKSNQKENSATILKEASELNPDYFFPSRVQEQIVLEWAIHQEVDPALAAYGLGNYYYDKKRHEKAIGAWELAAKKMEYGTLFRNLGIAYWNQREDAEKARAAFEKAIRFSPDDMRILFEYDQLRKKLNDSPEKRLSFLEPFKKKILTRDDFSVELAALYNFTGQYLKALQLMENKRFHPWEGGEGQVLRQYSFAFMQLGKIELKKGNAEKAFDYFEKAENTPDNLGEKYHPLQAKAKINYWKGLAFKALEKTDEAAKYFYLSASEQGDFIEMAVSEHSEMTYYRALSLKELGTDEKARKLLEELKANGFNKLKEKVKIDYFATSLPLLLVFEEDLQKRNEWENKYLIALAEKGLGNNEKAQKLAGEILQLNAMHVGARGIIDL